MEEKAAEPKVSASGELLSAWLRRFWRHMVGEFFGGITAVLDLAYLLCVGALLLLASPWPTVRRRLTGLLLSGARRLTELERKRIDAFHQGGTPRTDYGDRQALRYLALRWPLGLVGATILLLVGYGVWTIVHVTHRWLTVSAEYQPDLDGIAWSVLIGATLLFLAVLGIDGVGNLERQLAMRCLAPSTEQVLRRRVSELSTSRAEVVDAVNDERRRIERDLHDGVQQRLVALGMLIGRARRHQSPEQVEELLRQAQQESQAALNDLREVAWRVYPSALDDGGLAAALETVAERSGIPVRLQYDLTERPPAAVETVAYFVVAEAVTNAAKHSGAGSVLVDVTHEWDSVVVRVRDDGNGGADPAGSGLSGLARRVAALDGWFTVDSPPGGPTLIRMELPCE